MSYGISVGNTGATPVLTLQRTDGRSLPWRSRSRYHAPIGPPPISGSATLTVAFAVTLARGSILPTWSGPDGTTGTVYLEEIKKSRALKQNGDGREYTRTFQIFGTHKPDLCVSIGPQIGDTDDEHPDYYVTSREMKPESWGGGESDIVELTVTYVRPGPDSPQGGEDQPTFGYEFGGESEHIELALADQTNFGTTVAQAARIGRGINVNDEEIQGLDVDAPILDVNEEHHYTEQQFSPSFRKMLRDNLQKVNSADWREWAAGEVRFMSASARKNGKRWSVTFNFKVRRNMAQIPFNIYPTDRMKIANPLVVKVDKLGWQYLWVSSQRQKNPDDVDPGTGLPKSIRTVPVSVHVATVYETVDYAAFNIGTAPLP